MMTSISWLSILLGIIPISELRGAIPYAYFNGLPMWKAVLLGTLSNMVVPLIGFIFLETLHKILDKWNPYHRFFEMTISRARKKVGEKVDKYGLLGLMLFVAIPLPITGAWTGTIGAWVMGLDRKKSILFIILGVLISAAIVTTVILTGSSLAKLFTKQVDI